MYADEQTPRQRQSFIEQSLKGMSVACAAESIFGLAPSDLLEPVA